MPQELKTHDKIYDHERYDIESALRVFELYQKMRENKEKEARRLSDDELKKRLKYVKRQAAKREVSSATYERNLYVAEFVKRKANGICQLCEKPAPFNDKKGEPFLESHHIVWLSEGGEDTIENSTALCPNCHRKMHILNQKSDLKILNAKSNTVLA